MPVFLVSALFAASAALVAVGEAARPAVAQTASGAGEYVALSPARIFDTRQAGGGGPIAHDTTRDVQVTGLGGVPTINVLAVVVDLIVVNSTSEGWGLVWETGTTRPLRVSSINYVPGRAVANAATPKVSAAGKFSYYTWNAATDLIVDVVGYYRVSPGAGGYVPLTQTRILDTRESGARIAAGSTLDRKLLGVAGVPDSPEVTAVALNMSTLNQEAPGYITVYPRGQARPGTSSMNYGASRTQTNMVLATLSPDGWTSVYTSATTDMLFDVVGYYTKGSGAQLVTVTPQRVIDTRYAAGLGIGPITQALAPDTNTAIKLTGVAGVPETGVSTVLLNATADAGSSSAGSLSFWASGDQQPGTISLTYYPDENTANLVMAKVGSDGKVMVTNATGTTDLLIDIVGYFTEPDPMEDPLLRAGDAPFFSHDAYPLNDRLGARVNLGTGNLMISTADMAIPVVGGARVLGRTYNSLGLAPNSTGKTSPLFGRGWRFSEAPDHRLRANADGSVTYLSGTGRAHVFAAGTLAPPAGTDATLVKNADGSYKLTFHHSALVLNFRSDGLMTSEVDRNGNTIAFNYPAGGGYQTSIAGNAGAAPANTVTIAYGGPDGKVSSISQTADGTTRAVSYTYDDAGYLYQVTDAAGMTTFEHEPTNRNLTKITGPGPISQVTQFSYDSARRVTSVTRVLPAGNAVTSYNYADPTQPTRTDARNNLTTFTVDGAGRVIKATDAKGKFTTTEYTLDAKVGAFENATHGANGRTANTWDKNDGDSLSQSQSPTGALIKATYPTSGLKYLPDTVTDTMGNTSTMTYDGPGNVQSNANALNNAATIKYNADGTVDFSVDPMNVTSPDINLQDRTKATQYGYNTVRQLTSITPPAGNSLGVRNLAYDGFGRLKTVTTPASNVTTTYLYDELDRLGSETHSNGAPTISYDYDANGNLFHRTDGSGTTTFVHDPANRLTSKAIPSGPTLTYAYDAVGNLTSVGGDGRGTTTYQYDTVNRLEQMTESATGRINVFDYNADGQRTQTWYAAIYTGGGGVRYDGAGTVVPPSGFAAHILSEFNNANQLNRIKTTRASSDADANRVADISYSYGLPSPNPCPNPPAAMVQTGLRQSSTDNITGNVTNYCYDGAGRLVKAVTTGGPTYEWTYDADGNRRSGPEGSYPAYNTANQMTGPGTVDYDPNGNLEASPSLGLVYNGLDQTTSVTAGGNTVNMGYAGSGQAERSIVGATTQVNGILGVQAETTTGATTYYERDSQGTLVSERTPGGDYYYVFDGLGSVVGLVDPAGIHRAAYTYDPYGAQATGTALNGALPPNPWRYAGGYLDPTGLYHFAARYYEPATGRWTQQDSVVSLGNPARGNRYAYAGDDPVNHIDPSGLSFKKRVGEIAGDVADVAGVVAGGAAIACLGGVGCPFAAAAGAVSAGAAAIETGVECTGGDECREAGAGLALSGLGVGAQAVGRPGAAAFSDLIGTAFDFS